MFLARPAKKIDDIIKLSVIASALLLAACSDSAPEQQENPEKQENLEQQENSEKKDAPQGVDAVKSPETSENTALEARMAYKAENERFLAAFKSKDGVLSTESGLAYRILQSGTGEKPAADSYVAVKLKGSLIDGKTFLDTSDEEPIIQPLASLPTGLQETIVLMSVGDKYEVTIGQELGFGNAYRRDIPPFSTLIYEVELVKVTSEDNHIAELKAPNLAFLEEYKTQDGVTVTESGLMYKVLEANESGETPDGEAIITAHYEGKLIDGTLFDSSFQRGQPLTFPIDRVILGWQEAMKLMKTGETFEVVIPQELGYGANGAGDVIPEYATLVFKVQLVSFTSPAKQTQYLDDNRSREGVQVTDSGLQYKVVEEGTGETPDRTSRVRVHYAGRLIDGSEFDSSYKRGEPAVFPVSAVIAGWTEGLQLMKEGAKYEFYIPHNLGYGARGTGSIPPFSTLVFEVELLEVLN